MSTDTMPARTEVRDGCTAKRHDDAYAYSDFGCRCPAARKANAERVARGRAARRASRRVPRVRTRREQFRLPAAQPTPGFHFSLDPARSCAPGKVADLDFFFDESAEGRRAAKKVCRNCPVKAACREWALETGQEHGVWGETSSLERFKMLERREES